jgi:peptide-methionine (S)-S-oxide reductase
VCGDAQQVRIANAYIARLEQARVFPKATITKAGQDTGFHPAEAYHENYLTVHPDSTHIAGFDLPKIAALRNIFSR